MVRARIAVTLLLLGICVQCGASRQAETEAIPAVGELPRRHRAGEPTWAHSLALSSRMYELAV